MKTEAIPIVIGVLGTIKKGMENKNQKRLRSHEY